jgi:tetratricopeptide (TPR) repeat protein
MTIENRSLIPSASSISHGNEDHHDLAAEALGSKNRTSTRQRFLYPSYLPYDLDSLDTNGHSSMGMTTITGAVPNNVIVTPFYPMVIQRRTREPCNHNAVIRWPPASFTISSANAMQTPVVGTPYHHIPSHSVPTLSPSSSSLPTITGYPHSNPTNQADTSLLPTQATPNTCVNIEEIESTIYPVVETPIRQDQCTPIKRRKLLITPECGDVQVPLSSSPLSQVSCSTFSSSPSSYTSSAFEPAELTSLEVSIFTADQDKCLTSATQAEMRGELDKAIAIYESMLISCPSSWETLCKLGDAYLKKQDFAPALDAYQRVLQHNPHFLEIHSRIGKCFLNLGELHQAYLTFQKAVALLAEDRQTFDLWADIGLLYEQYSMFKESQMAYERAILFEPSHKRLFEIQCRLGMLCKYSDQFDEALKWFEAALLTFETTPQMVASHADVYFQIGQIMNFRKLVGYRIVSLLGFLYSSRGCTKRSILIGRNVGGSLMIVYFLISDSLSFCFHLVFGC